MSASQPRIYNYYDDESSEICYDFVKFNDNKDGLIKLSLYEKIRNLLNSGFSNNWSKEDFKSSYFKTNDVLSDTSDNPYVKKRWEVYNEIYALLKVPSHMNTLKSYEIQYLCEYYKKMIYDNHGYYPPENSLMLLLLKKANVTRWCDNHTRSYL
jgi:hypothetical protein